jgi:hypothetical protein
MQHFERTKLSGFMNLLLPISTLPYQPGMLPVLLTLAIQQLHERSDAVTKIPRHADGTTSFRPTAKQILLSGSPNDSKQYSRELHRIVE